MTTRPEPARSRPVLASLLVGAVVAAVAAVLASRIPGPSLLWDGQAYLGAARWVARDRWPSLGPLDPYHPGYGILLAPGVWAGWSPMGLFRWAQAVNVASVLVAAVALGALARSWLPPRRALAATAAALVQPAVLVQPGFEWPEAPLIAGVAVATVLAWRERWTGVAVVAVMLYALHPRGLVVVLVTLVAAAAVRNWRALAVLAVGVAGVMLFNQLAVEALYDPGARSSLRTVRVVATHPEFWDDVLVRAAGHLWYQVVASVGLAGVALLALGRDRRPAARWLLAVALGLLVVSAVQLVDVGRADHLVYGRYVETVSPVLVVVAARWLTMPRILATAATVIALAWVTHLANPADDFRRGVAAVNVPALHLLGGIDLHHATAAAVAALLIVGVLAVRLHTCAIIGVGALAFAAGLSVHTAELRPFAESANGTYQLADDLARFADDGVVAYDVDAYDMLASNRYQWAQPSIELARWRGGPPPSNTILSGKAVPVDGARLVAVEPHRDLALWVVPGRRQDELAARGWLIAEHGDAVGAGFYRATITPVGSGRVRITHTGSGPPWVPEHAMNGDVGIVRVLVDGAARLLPSVVRPGESIVIRVPDGTRGVVLEHVHHDRRFGDLVIADQR